MRSQEPAGDADASRDPLLETAFTHFVQQAQAPPAFAARVRARAQRQRAEVGPRSWGRRLVAWLGAGGPWDVAGDDQREPWLARLQPGLGVHGSRHLEVHRHCGRHAARRSVHRLPFPLASRPVYRHCP